MTNGLFDDADLAIFGSRPFTFARKPLALPPDQRLSWRLPLLLITLKHVRSSKASFARLALTTFALCNPSFLSKLITALEMGHALGNLPTRYEPGLPFLLNFAFAKNLIRISERDQFTLTELGDAAAQRIEHSGAFDTELSFLREYGSKLNEASTNRIMSRGLFPDIA
jgi:hypothetical protein